VSKLDQRNCPSPNPAMSFLGIEGCHAFVTGARGGIGEAIVQELLGIFSLFHTVVGTFTESITDFVFRS
jgi:hypothetical protein